MPELPDLQIFSQNLNIQFAGKTVSKIKVVNKKKLKVPEKQLKQAFENEKLLKVFREGKQLRMIFNNSRVLGLHLMLRGSLHQFEKKNGNKYTIIEILFDDDTGLAMTDHQGQAIATLDPEESKAPDALSKNANARYLQQIASGSKATIKNLLMDQLLIRGIGNAYADEILWEAGISPFSIAEKLPEKKIKDLARSIKKVLKSAEKKIRSLYPDIISGEHREFLSIHNADKKKSPTGAAIKHEAHGGRKTYFTKEQELYL